MTEDLHQCPLCGFRFDASALSCHTSCPMSSGCHILCCPNCGYQVPDENRLRITRTLKRAWETRRTRHEESLA